MTPEQTIELVQAAQDDLPGAMDRLVDAWLPTVVGWCTRLGGRGVYAEDAAHDVFMKMLDRLPTLRSPGAFPAWLYGITRRVVAAHRRKAWLRRWLPGAVPDIATTQPDPGRASEQSQVATRVWAALEALPLHHREVLVLCDLEERADSEAAQILGIPRNTVKSRLRRARAALRADLMDLRDDPVLSGQAEAI